MSNLTYYGVFKCGNKKIDKSVLIFNMNSATDCPSRRLHLCRYADICYAKKAEKQYPNVLPYRRKQENYWKSTLFQDIIADIKQIINKNPKIKFIRFNESGDFETQYDVYRLNHIAKALKPLGIRIYGYTARSDLNFKDVAFIIRGSNCDMRDGSTQVIGHEYAEMKGSYVKINGKQTWICPGEQCGKLCVHCMMGRTIQANRNKRIAFVQH